MSNDWSEEKMWAVIVVGLAVCIVGAITGWILIDNHITMTMAEKKLCYTSVARPNSSPTWEWRACKITEEAAK